VRGTLNAVPTLWLLVAAVAVMLSVVLLLVLVIRRIVPATREGYHAEVSAPMLGVVAAVFGLLLAFVIIIAYQNFLSAQANVSAEADALASIVRDSAAFPSPGGTNVRAAVGAYARAVVNEEWPEMRKGRESPLALTELANIFQSFQTVKTSTHEQTAFYDDAVSQLNNALVARRDRLKSVGGGLPRDIVILLLFSAFVIIGYAVLVGSPNYWFHAIGPAAIAMVVAVSLVVLFDLSYPFSGDVAIAPSDFKAGTLEQYFSQPTRPH
jgi:Protein of unknown function (DUF4239)